MIASERLEHAWQAFRAAPPGERFQRQVERLRGGSFGQRAAQIGAGLAAIATGLGLLFAPGPGLLLIGLGLLLVLGSDRVARAFDRVEPALRDLVLRVKRRGWARVAVT